MTDGEIIKTFEKEIENDPSAYERPDECVYQITAKELVRSARAIERAALKRAAERCMSILGYPPSEYYAKAIRELMEPTS